MLKLTAIIKTTLLSVLLSGTAQAALLDRDTINTVHKEVLSAFSEKCMKSMEGATQNICECLARKASENLDDKTLARCENPDSSNGGICISEAVNIATQKALAKESIVDCLNHDDTAKIKPAAGK